MIRGCDLSAVQGVLTDDVWQKLAAEDIKFAFLRAVVGNDTWPDGSAKENAARAKAHGILVAPYCFSYPLPHLDPVQQAEYFVRQLEGLGLMPDELPPMLDAEWPPREEYKVINGVKTLTYPWRDQWKCTPDQIRDFLVKQLARLDELTGIEWLMYSFRYWLTCIAAEKDSELTKRRLVLADYTYQGRFPSDDELAKLALPAGFHQMPFIQHDGNGGLKLPDGRDADFDVFRGGEEELRALASQAGQPVELPPVDTELASQDMRGCIVDDEIAAYRRDRIDSTS